MIYILTALTISLTILGLHYTIESLLNNLLGVSLDDIEHEFGKASYPIIYCPTCMTSFWGLIFLISCPFVNFNYYEYIITFFQIGFFNYAISKFI